MKENYITKMPDKAGAFLEASKIISANGGNIVRVSYNKAVDAHTLFIEVEADDKELSKITEGLTLLGYLFGNDKENKVILVEFKLRDVSGAVKPVLEIIRNYDINISYITSQENGTEFQHFKMGLLIDNTQTIKNLLDEVSKICDVKILEYDMTEKLLDNTVFYIGFSNEMRNLLSLNQDQTNNFIINANRIMQLLDEKNDSPHKTFEYIRKFVKFVTAHKAQNFKAGVHKKIINEKIVLYMIEPPCGSNVYIFEAENDLLFVDSGFACFENEMNELLINLFKDFASRKKSVIITHTDIDHTGMINMFDKVYLSKSSYENFYLEKSGGQNFREQNRLHLPYYKLSRIITNYKTPELKNMEIIGEKLDDAVLSKIGEIEFYGLKLEAYEGLGGHVKGETVIICEEYKLMFTGDCLVNIKGFSPEQKEFNSLAPYLMQSVNINSSVAGTTRIAIEKLALNYLVCPGHGLWFEQK